MSALSASCAVRRIRRDPLPSRLAVAAQMPRRAPLAGADKIARNRNSATGAVDQLWPCLSASQPLCKNYLMFLTNCSSESLARCAIRVRHQIGAAESSQPPRLAWCRSPLRHTIGDRQDLVKRPLRMAQPCFRAPSQATCGGGDGRPPDCGKCAPLAARPTWCADAPQSRTWEGAVSYNRCSRSR
jgi:hypothetical protein